MLTKERLKEYIETKRPEMLIFYGTKTQEKIHSNVKEIMNMIKEETNENSEKYLTLLIKKIEQIKLNELINEEKTIVQLPLLHKMFNPMKHILKKYEELLPEIEKDMANLVRIKTKLIRENIVIGEISKNREVIQTEIELLIKTAEEVYEGVIDEEKKSVLKRRIEDLKISNLLLTQMNAQIVMLKTINDDIIHKSQELLNNTIPLWKTHINYILQKRKEDIRNNDLNKIEYEKIKEIQKRQQELLEELTKINGYTVKKNKTLEETKENFNK